MKRKAYDRLHRMRNLFLFSDRIQAYNTALNMWERSLGKTVVKSMPLVAQVEATNRCNLNCVFCFRHNYSLALGDLGSELVSEVVQFSRRSRDLVLFGYGEPLVAPVLHDLLKKGGSGRISFTTNGLLLTSEMMERIIAESSRPIYQVTFSIDAVDPQIYMSIRKRSNPEVVWDNLRSLNEYKMRGRYRWPELVINFVAMDRNLEELPALIEKAATCGVSQINVFHLSVWDEAYTDESLIHYPERTRGVFEQAREKADELGIRLDLPIEICEGKRVASEKCHNGIPKCYQPWSYCYIRHDGRVQACCFSENLVMGNLKEKSFAEIWNDQPYRDLRASINKTLQGDCRRCEMRFRYVPSPNDWETYIKLSQQTK